MYHSYLKSNRIFGIYIDELPSILNFQIIRKFSSRVMAIVKFVQLVPKVVQVAETHIDECISSENVSHSFQSIFDMYKNVIEDPTLNYSVAYILHILTTFS